MGSYTGSLSKEEVLQNCSKFKFIDAANKGELSKEDINKWLLHDFQFLVPYVQFLEHVHDLAPENEKEFWDSIVGTVEEEIIWYDKALKERGVSTEDAKHQAGKDDDHWLLSYMENKSYLTLATVVYAFEFSTYEIWKKSKNNDIRRFANRWGTRAAKQYADDFGTVVDRAAKTASEADQKEALEAWSNIMKIEASHDYMNQNPQATTATGGETAKVTETVTGTDTTKTTETVTINTTA